MSPRSRRPHRSLVLVLVGATIASWIHDRHVMGLFPRAAWLERIAGAGFRATAVPFEIGVKLGVAHEVFVGVRPDAVG